jgi:hypothetical protein
MAIKKHQSTKGLILSGSGDLLTMCPVNISLLSSIGVMFDPKSISQLVEELFWRFNHAKGVQ